MTGTLNIPKDISGNNDVEGKGEGFNCVQGGPSKLKI